MNSQETYDSIVKKKEQIKLLSEEILKLQSDHFAIYEDAETPILVEDKPKFFRVHKPDGRFVYNVEFDIGVRAKAVKIWEEK